MPEAQRATGEADDVARLRQLIEATRVAQVIYVVAEFGLPDLLQDGPRSVEDLAMQKKRCSILPVHRGWRTQSGAVRWLRHGRWYGLTN